jgi:hypothetical protein
VCNCSGNWKEGKEKEGVGVIEEEGGRLGSLDFAVVEN